MSNYGVVRTDNLKATKNGHIRSGRFYVSTTPTAVENGGLVVADTLLDGAANREIFKCTAPSALTDVNVYLVATPELIYNETQHYSLADFRNEAGENITLLGLEKGDLLSLSDECIVPIAGTSVVGNLVTLTVASTKWTEKTAVTTEVLVGKIIARELYKNGSFLNVIEIQ